MQRLEISAESRENAGEWEIWIHQEKSAATAREEFASFTAEPDHPRYADIAPVPVAPPADPAKRPARSQEFRREWRANGGNQLSLAIIAIAVGVTLLEMVGGNAEALDRALSIVPYERRGAWIEWEPLLTHLRNGEVWRLVTPMFLHSGAIHLILNCLWVFYVGSMIERRIGLARFLGLTLMFAVASNVIQYWLEGPAFGGLSGVVYGYFGYAWMKTRLAPSLGYALSQEIVVLAVGWAFLCLFSSYVANGAHFAGLVLGVICGAVPELLRARRR